VALVVQNAPQSILAEKSRKAMLGHDLGDVELWPRAHTRKQRLGRAAKLCAALFVSTRIRR